MHNAANRTCRVLLAAEIPPQLKLSIHLFQSHLLSQGYKIRPFPADKLHITLCYINPLHRTQLPRLISHVNSWLSFDAMNFDIRRISYWSPSILCIRLSKCPNANELNKLATTSLSNGSITVIERYPFVPHITIARTSPRSVPPIRILQSFDSPLDEFTVDEVHLFETGKHLQDNRSLLKISANADGYYL